MTCAESVHDRMTEQPYLTRLTSFKLGIEPAPIKTYPVLARGKEELKEVRGAEWLGRSWTRSSDCRSTSRTWRTTRTCSATF